MATQVPAADAHLGIMAVQLSPTWDPSSHVSLDPAEFYSRIPTRMLRPKPCSWENMIPSGGGGDSHPPTDSHHQFCPQGAPVPGYLFDQSASVMRTIGFYVGFWVSFLFCLALGSAGHYTFLWLAPAWEKSVLLQPLRRRQLGKLDSEQAVRRGRGM